jgi:ribonuclease Z
MDASVINVSILGEPPNDNALFVVIADGKTTSRLLIDCGAETVGSMSYGDIQNIDHIFISHLHMDHISGFDSFFRINFNRTNRENHIWVPKGSAEIIWHRMQGFWWSHASELSGIWHVHDVGDDTIQTYRLEAREGFGVMHDAGMRSYDRVIVALNSAQVEAIPLKHHGLCLGYLVREHNRINIDQRALAGLEIRPGPWINLLKSCVDNQIEIDGIMHDALTLKDRLIIEESGDCIAYLTDFLSDAQQRHRISPYLKGVKTLYAEAQYAPKDFKLADKYHHSTVEQIAELAKMADVGNYTLLHLSRRYDKQEWIEMLEAAQAIFPSSSYIEKWGIAG